LSKRTLIVDTSDNANLALSSRNVRDVTLVGLNKVNVYELLTHETVALTRDVAAQLDKQLSARQEIVR